MIREELKILFYLLILTPFLYMTFEVGRELLTRFQHFFLKESLPAAIKLNRFPGTNKKARKEYET